MAGAWHRCASKANRAILYPRSNVHEQVLRNISCHSCPNWGGSDTLFHWLEQHQHAHYERQQKSRHEQDEPASSAATNERRSRWGSILDAGTGETSLGWILGAPSYGARLDHQSLVAVTAEPGYAAYLRDHFSYLMRPGVCVAALPAIRWPFELTTTWHGMAWHGMAWHGGEQDSIVVGNWMNDSLLGSDSKFDVVLADYLIGAVEGYAPYQQGAVLERLGDFLNDDGILYLVGAEPLASASAAHVRMPAAARYLRIRGYCLLGCLLECWNDRLMSGLMSGTMHTR